MTVLILIRLLAFVIIDFLMIIPFIIPAILYLIFGPKCVNGDTTVVLIHGSGVKDWQWAVAKLYLYCSRISFMSVNYNYSQQISKSCDDVMTQIPLLKNIILIGHSQGGLIARSIHTRINSSKTFLMNTPQKGAIILNWLYPKENIKPCSDNDMRFNSEFIRNLPQVNPDNIHEIVGINDYVRMDHCIADNSNRENIYFSWFGHYFTAVNPFLWLLYIIPQIKKIK